jgi:hypothetical protein
MSLPEPELKKIKLTDLSPNDYNPQEMPKDKYTGLVAHMRSVGFTDPLKVRPREENDPEIIKSPYVLVDGEHRLRAYMEVFPEETEILCAIMKGPEGQYLTRQQAIVSTIAYNFQHGEENPIKMAQALRIALDGGMLIEDIEDLTGMKRNRIEAFMEFEKLPESSLPPFEPDNSGSDLKPKDDPIIMAFAVYPDDRVVIERAIASQKNHLPPDTAIEEEKGRCLLIICQKVLGEFKDVGTQNGTKDENHSEA